MTTTLARTRPLSLRAPIATEEERSLFQRRLRLSAIVVVILSFGFWVIATASVALTAPDKLPLQFVSRPALVENATSLLGLLVWMLARRGKLKPTTLDFLDVMSAAGLCLGWTLMSCADHNLRTERPEMITLLACSYTLVTRAALVPSTPARTAVIGFLGMAPVVPATWFMYRGVELMPQPLSPPFYTAIWGLLGVAATTVISQVIYGLRMEIRKAMQLGQYSLEEEIGQGGMGVVYRASHALLRRPAAIKLLAGAEKSGPAAERFEREVQITARLTHPNTVAVFDYGRTPEGVFYYAMEYLEGVTLEDLVEAHGPQPESRVVHVLLQICGALEEAHAAGLVHRDIKPANVMLTERGGILDVVKESVESKADARTDLKLSGVNTILGTPHYMAPEAILDPTQIDGRADLYGVGAIAYYLLTGERVFEGSNLVEVCSMHLHQAPLAPSSKRALSDGLEKIVLACLAKKADDRPRDAAALAKMLRGCGVAEWTREDAKAFWDRIGGPNESGRRTKRAKPANTEVAKTVAVDLAARQAL